MKSVKIIVSVAFIILTALMLSIKCSKDKSIEPSSTSAKWTILVYAAGNTYMDSTMDGRSYCLSDIQAIENVGSSADVNVIAMLSSLHTSGIAKYYKIEQFNDSANVISSPILENLGGRNMADAITLKDFLLYGMRNFPAENYMLLIDGYGVGWPGSCRDDINGGGALMPATDMANAIEEALAESSTPRLKIMAFYSQLMGMTEVAYELRNCADWLVASEITSPMQNMLMPQNWLTPLVSDPGITDSLLAINFAQAVLNGGNNEGRLAQIAVVNLLRIPRLAELAGNFGRNLFLNSGQYWNYVLEARDDSHRDEIDYPAYVDLYDFLDHIYDSGHLHDIQYVQAYYDSLNDILLSTIPFSGITYGYPIRKGLAIHLPATRELYDSTNYAGLDFNNLGWNHFVSNFISMAEGSGLPTTISGTVTSPDQPLSDHAYVIADTFHVPNHYPLDSSLVDPTTGNFRINMNILDSIAFAFEAWDDINQDGRRNYGDGYGFWDRDGDNQWDPASHDQIWAHPGQNITDINIRIQTIYPKDR